MQKHLIKILDDIIYSQSLGGHQMIIELRGKKRHAMYCFAFFPLWGGFYSWSLSGTFMIHSIFVSPLKEINWLPAILCYLG